MDGELLSEEEEGGYWPFCILPNVNGQKYTIGETFKSRKEQGEFIFLSSVRCDQEIKVENDKFFVSPPASRKSAIFINNVKVLTKTELGFGDILSLGKDKAKIFLFQERKIRPNRKYWGLIPKTTVAKVPTVESTAEFTPGQNGLILSNILSHLSIKDLKSARFVSKLWNEEGFKIVRKGARLRLDFSRGYYTSESIRLFRYSVEMTNNPMPNWKINFPSFCGDGKNYANQVERSAGKPGAKLLEDLNYFIFDPSTRIRHLSVKRLELGGDMDTKFDFDLRIKLLQALGPGLEELVWGGKWDLYRSAPVKDTYSFPAGIGLSKLRVFTLSISLGLYHTQAKDSSKFNWLKELIRAIRGVTTLRLNCELPLALPFLTKLLENETFSNLNDIAVHHLNPAVIQLLLNLNFVQPLKKLKVYELQAMKKADFHPFERLLWKHAQSLESLLFIIPNSPVKDGDKDLPPVFISFPVFPKLQQLNIGLAQQAYPKTKDDIKLLFSDGTGYINYERDLPCLKSLNLWPLGFGKYPSGVDGKSWATDLTWKYCSFFYEMFFPAIVERRENNDENGEVAICKTLQFMDIVHSVPTRGYYDKPLFSKAMQTVIASMFPNLETNPWINSIRERNAALLEKAAAKIKAKKEKAENKTVSKKKTKTKVVGQLRLATRELRPRTTDLVGLKNNIL